MNNNIFVFTNSQKILNFLLQHSDEKYIASDIQKKLHLSRGGVNQSLRELARYGYINREKKGIIYIYSANNSNNTVKQFKILATIEILSPLVEKLKIHSNKIILFGSSSRGEHVPKSDIDLFILSNNYDDVMSIINKTKIKRKIQPIIRSPIKFTEMETKESVFYNEIIRGVTLWEIKE